jgi:hypothetical protein
MVTLIEGRIVKALTGGGQSRRDGHREEKTDERDGRAGAGGVELNVPAASYHRVLEALPCVFVFNLEE